MNKEITRDEEKIIENFRQWAIAAAQIPGMDADEERQLLDDWRYIVLGV